MNDFGKLVMFTIICWAIIIAAAAWYINRQRDRCIDQKREHAHWVHAGQVGNEPDLSACWWSSTGMADR